MTDRPARGSGAQLAVLLGAWLNGRTQNVREMIPRHGDVLIEPGLKARITRMFFRPP
jgi:hypothetical protein